MNYIAFTRAEADRIAEELPDAEAIAFRNLLSAVGEYRRADADAIRNLSARTGVKMNPLAPIVQLVDHGLGVNLQNGCCG